ncbi:hypothetical protein ACLOJK_029493 [Asimina triloba]
MLVLSQEEASRSGLIVASQEAVAEPISLGPTVAILVHDANLQEAQASEGSILKLVSALKAMSLVRKRCVAFLTLVVDACPESKSLDEISVREVEFGIDTHPGMEPVSRALYHIAPVEMTELKEQFQNEDDETFMASLEEEATLNKKGTLSGESEMRTWVCGTCIDEDINEFE